MTDDTEHLSCGIYTVRDAAALLGISPGRVRSLGTRDGQPLWEPTFPDRGPHSALTFWELLDLGATVLLKEEMRTSFAKVRAIREGYGVGPYPLINQRSDLGERRRHIAHLLDQLDYEDGADLPVRWWPLGRDVPVLMDRRQHFGRAVVADRFVPTDALTMAVGADGSFEIVSRQYGIPLAHVMAAVVFELRKQGRGFLELPFRM